MSNVNPSSLYIVATPIGNRSDITERARAVLEEVDLIAAEDTRHTRQLLNHLGIQNDLISVHDHNERDRIDTIIGRLKEGQSVALVSDAGTPAISDPGFILVRGVRQAGFNVHPIPGASAVIAALSAAGIATDRFMFDGFLPTKQTGRLQQYASYQAESRTVVVYESSHRIAHSLRDLVEALGADRQIVVCRELTKLFETFLSGTAEEVLAEVNEDSNQQKGEFVILIEGVKQQQAGDEEVLKVLTPLAAALPPKQAAALTAEITGCKKKDAYNLALSLKQ